MQHLIEHDILEAIQINLEVGNITIDDAIKLRRLTHKLDVEIMQKEHEKAMAELKAEKDEEIAVLKAENADALAENAALKAELEKLKALQN